MLELCYIFTVHSVQNVQLGAIFRRTVLLIRSKGENFRPPCAFSVGSFQQRLHQVLAILGAVMASSSLGCCKVVLVFQPQNIALPSHRAL
jgi:hypothetical protein